MAGGEVDSLTSLLSETSVDGKNGLSFAGRGIKMNDEETAKEVINAIKKCGKLQWLRLEGNTLGVEAAKGIAKALEGHSEFERALWSDMFTGRLKSEIPDALRYLGNGIILANAKLVELDLSDNAFGPNGMEGLVDFLKSPSCFSLKELRLNNNGLGITGGKMLAASLLECHKKSTEAGQPLALRVFVSGRGRLENEGSTRLAEAFKVMGSLEEVRMPQNGIFHPGIMALAEAFACNPHLKTLDLSDNIFTEEGAKAMAKALPKMTELEVVNFGDCLIKTEGAQAIAEVFKNNNTKLKEITLSFNEITSEGGVAIANAVHSKADLKKLDLNGNQLGSEGERMIREIFENAGKDEEILGSFSDDEGTEDEDEGDEEAEEEENEEDEGEVVEIQDPNLEVHGIGLTPRPEDQKLTPEEFLKRPSAASLLALGPDRAELISKQVYKDDVCEVGRALMKVASVVKPDAESVQKAAFECADSLLNDCLDEDPFAAALSNEILVQLGLIKSEDKALVSLTDVSGPLIVLHHVVQQAYFPKICKDILQIFIAKPNSKLDSRSELKHKLLQALYQ